MDPCILVEKMRNVPLLKQIMRWRDRRKFCRSRGGCFWGVYNTASAALSDVPPRKNLGYDNEASADLYRDQIGKINSHDYPLLFWLAKIVANECSIFDFGGHFGIKYYNFRKYLPLAPNARWVVYDLPQVVVSGREWAKTHGETSIEFVDVFAGFESDVFFASGSLQYLDHRVSQTLGRMKRLPKHVLIGSLPVNQEGYFTLQNIGVAVCPYQVFGLLELKRDMESTGYELIDSWREPEKGCYIPQYPRHTLRHYMGFYFRLA